MAKPETASIVFVGQPNCGKSTLFNAIAGYKAHTSNFPGTTVTHAHSQAYVDGHVLTIIDLPGVYSLNPSDPAEKAALTHLFQEPPDLIVNVVDASILGRSLELTLELLEMEQPMLVALNMVDLAEKKGIKIDAKKLEKTLGVPVVMTVANRGVGVRQLMARCLDCLTNKGCVAAPPSWSKDVEQHIHALAMAIPDGFCVVANPRFTAIKLVEAGEGFCQEMLQEISPRLSQRVVETRHNLESMRHLPAYEAIAAERHHLALKILEDVARVQRGKKITREEKIDSFLMHPILGYPVLALVFFLFFLLIFLIGNPLERILLQPWSWLQSWINHLAAPPLFLALLDGLAQGVGGGIAIVLPYFLPLLLLMALLEDLGYLARRGFLLDSLMHRLGLHGKSVAPFILGFGCNVPAVVSTRILESKRDRFLTSLLIPFIPCSARTTIILALVAFFLGPWWAMGFYFFQLLVVGLVGRLLSFFIKEPSPGLILEIPSLKLPSLRHILAKVSFELRSFIRFAWPILIAGSLLLSLGQWARLDLWMNRLFSPLVHGVLGLPASLGVTLIFGLLRKELALLMMLQALGVDYAGLPTVITKSQLVVFTAFVSLFIPCVSTVAIIWREVGKKVALLSMALNLAVAIIVAVVLRLVL